MRPKDLIYTFVLIGMLIALINSCKKEDRNQIPTLTTNTLSNITQTTASSGGNITSDGGAAITIRGVCWSTNPIPTIADNKTIDGSGAGSFTSDITGLTANTAYYIRAYATNSLGIGYGSAINFKTAQIPIIKTIAPSNIGINTAFSGGNITSDGGTTVTARGICWSTNPTPTITNSKTTDGKGTGSYTSNLTGLTSNTTYYVRAYATNSYGTFYGDETTFKTYNTISTETVTDIDGNVYHTVKIGTQVWMVENLKVTRDRYGKSISTTSPATLKITNTAFENRRQWAYDGKESNVATYGRLYTYYTVLDLDICPPGWHVPTTTEWLILINYLGGENVAGVKLKESGFSHWISDGIYVATNESAFTALPSGYRANDGNFYGMGVFAYYWSMSGDMWSDPDCITLGGLVHRGKLGGLEGLSVRCIRD